MQRLESKLDLDCVTVTGRSVGENVATAEVFDEEVIRSVDDPVHPYGGIAVLEGSLAPTGAVIKQVAVDESLWKFEGPAKVFDSEEEATEAVFSKGIEPGDVVVIRYEGPKGGPGMREMQMFRALLKFGGLDNKVYLITDGRFSGYTGGACIGYLSPEEAEGGPLALIRDGDVITIDVESRKLDVKLSDEELERRAKEWKRPPPRVTAGYLARYAERATSAATGAIVR